jgi:hypothetical protein
MDPGSNTRSVITSLLLVTLPCLAAHATSAAIDAVFFAQTHVQQPDHPYFKLIGSVDTLLKVHVIAPGNPPSPLVTAQLSLNNAHTNMILRGPARLPAAISIEPGIMEHRFDNCFTTMIPKAWIQPGITISIAAGKDRVDFDDLKVGAPTIVNMTMFDMHFFAHEERDYDPGWQRAMEVKWPMAALKIDRIPNIVLKELIVPPRPNGKLPAVRCSSPEEYKAKTGKAFDGEQSAALRWKSALQHAGGQLRRRLFFVNIYNVNAGGQAGNYGGCARAGSTATMFHELGHAFSLPHWIHDRHYPYWDSMHGIVGKGPHVGPTWGFDRRIGLPGAPAGMPRFISPIVHADAFQGKPGEWKHDPMQGGMNDADPGFLLRMLSGYSVYCIQRYLERHVVLWDDSSERYISWDPKTEAYSRIVESDGISLPLERDVKVISVMAGISAVTPEANIVYPPIGPYTSGLIHLFDPSVPEDRKRAAQGFAPAHGCDLSLRVVQGGKTKIYMLPASWKPEDNPVSGGSFNTRAINLPARDGKVTRAELLLTPDAEKNGLPEAPKVLDSWSGGKLAKIR